MKFEIIIGEQTPKVEPEQDWQKSTEDIKAMIANHGDQLKAFLEFAKTKSTAVGLAANQVSLDGERFMHRCFAIRNIFGDGSWRLIFDPVITERYGIKIQKSEGCLTWPHKKIISERNRFVKVSYYTVDENFEEVTRVDNEEHEGFEAQIWQHETNHLNGVEQRVEQGSFILHVKEPGRNDTCPCGSGKKYKACCHAYVNPPVVRRPLTADEQLGKAGERLMGKL
jgi:peptide deformylase